mgnify:CR=1 FL=1
MTASEARKSSYDPEPEFEGVEPAADEGMSDDIEPPPRDPSWFSRTYVRLNPEDMASRYEQSLGERGNAPVFATPSPEAYEAYKRRLEERFRTAQSMADPAHGAAPLPLGNRASPKAKAPTRPVRAPFAPRAPHTRKAAPAGRGMASAVVLTLLACGVGGAGGFVAAHPSILASMVSDPRAVVSKFYAGWFAPSEQTANLTLHKAVPVARFDVSDVSGPVNGPIPLGISTFPTNAESPIAIRISGLPPEAYLTRGVALAQGQWLVKSAELAKAELVVPRSTTSQLGLEVAALDEKTGQEAAPPQIMNVALDLAAVPLPGAVPPPETLTGPQSNVQVTPVSAMPDQGFNHPAEVTPVPQPLQTANAEAQTLLAKGQALLKNGDLISARQFFLKANALKLPDAAYFVGQTYDPATYNTLHVVGLQPDAQLAAEWYGKAAAQGVAQANEALTKLGSN